MCVTYLPGWARMRSFAFFKSVSRSPNSSAPAGHDFTQAGSELMAARSAASADARIWPLNSSGGAKAKRSWHMSHLEIFGASESHSAVGTPQGQAHMQ